MGWSNFIIIPRLKLLIEIPREIDEIRYYEESAIKRVIDEENIDYDDHFEGDDVANMGDVLINKITIKDLTELYKRYDIVQSLAGMDYNKLLLFWLKNRGIDFEIKSEYNIDKNEYEKEGYMIIER